MKKLSRPVLDLIRKNNLSESFFETGANAKKADTWFLEAQKLILKCESETIGVIANTGAGKTVIALLVAILSGKRTLFIVPNKDLVFGHQLLLAAMGSNLQSKTLTGDYEFSDRVWGDEDDRIIFATASLVEKEISYGELVLTSFGLVVGDEIHHAASESTSYSKISHSETDQKLWWLALTASPGNKVERIISVRENFQIDEFVKVKIETPGVNTSVIIAEQAEVCSNINYIKAEELVLSELNCALDKVNATSLSMSLGSKLEIDPKKTFKRKDVDALRKQVRAFGKLQLMDSMNQKLLKRLASNLEQYAFWAHVYELFKAESFYAIKEYYQNNLCKKTTWYAKDIIKKGSAQMLLALTNNLTHPKEEMLGKVVLSCQRRGAQPLIFESNKATAISDYHYLSHLKITTDCIFSGKGMTIAVKKAVLSKFKDKETFALIATDMMREGHNLSVDVVIHKTPPTHPIQRIQRDGRAGRDGKCAEVIIIASDHEMGMIPAVARQIKRLNSMDFNSGKILPLKPTKKTNPQQLLLFT